MQPMQRVSGDRSHLSPVYGKYAPEAVRITETTDIIDELDAVLNAGDRIPRKTEKVYGLWQRAGARHEEKGEDVIAANSSISAAQARIDAGNRFVGFLAGVATVVVVAASAWAVFS